MFQLFSKRPSVTERERFSICLEIFPNSKITNKCPDLLPHYFSVQYFQSIYCWFLDRTNSNIFRLRDISSILNYPGDNLTYRHHRGISSSLYLTKNLLSDKTQTVSSLHIQRRDKIALFIHISSKAYECW